MLSRLLAVLQRRHDRGPGSRWTAQRWAEMTAATDLPAFNSVPVEKTVGTSGRIAVAGWFSLACGLANLNTVATSAPVRPLSRAVLPETAA